MSSSRISVMSVRLTEIARTEGVLIEGAGWHWSDPQSAPPALVLGYGSIESL